MNCVRLESINGEYHVVLTFLKELKVFSVEYDCIRFTEIMIEVMDKMECKMFMQSLMPDHVHIIVQEGEEKKLSSIAISLCTRFAKYFNKSRNRKGRIFSKRYQRNHGIISGRLPMQIKTAREDFISRK